MAKNPIPTEAKPHPATSSYRNAPKRIREQPTTIIINVAHASTVFLFIPIVYFSLVGLCRKLKGKNKYRQYIIEFRHQRI